MREYPAFSSNFRVVEITHAIGDVMLEIGTGEFFPGLAKELTAPLQSSAGIGPASSNSIAGLKRSSRAAIRKHVLPRRATT